MTRTLVIGAGIAGIATAALLAREGHQVTVLEKNDRAGGRAGVIQRDGFRFDTGPSWYLMPRVFDHFFRMMGTTTQEQLDLLLLDPGYRVFSQPKAAGHPATAVTVPFGADAVGKLFEQLEPGSSTALNSYLDSAREAAVMAEQHFLYNPFTRPSWLAAAGVRRLLPRLLPLLTQSLERYVARRFQHPVIRQILGYPAVFLGTDPRHAPALYHLMSALDLDEGVQYPMSGFGGLVERLVALARSAGATFVTGATVERITTEGRGASRRATGVIWSDTAGVSHTADADIVVSAADLHHTETALLDRQAQSYPESWWRRRRSGPGAVIGLLGVDGELPQLPHHSLFFTRDWNANFDAIFGANPHIPEPASIYVCKPSASDPGVAPIGSENLFVLIPVPPRPDLGHGGSEGAGDQPIERAIDQAIDQISAWAEIPDLRARITVRESLGPADFASDYFSWQGGMLGPSHTLRQSAMFRPQNASKKVSGLYYAGATTAPGIGVPLCLISAELVLKRIRGDHSSGPLLNGQEDPWG